jgi:hypothetical protein
MPDQPTPDLDAIEARAAHLYEYAQQTGEGDTLAGTDVPALLAEVRRLRAELADQQAETEKLIRWRREDETAMKQMRGTIERLRGEKREFGELAARRESELLARRDAPPHVRAARYAAAGDEMAASLVRDGFGDDEIADMLGRRPCGHDDYHDPHEWADRPGVWCPGHSHDDDPAVSV